MKIIKTVDELLSFRSTIVSSVGFVPTMGALHKGHLSLVEKSLSCCESTIVSIFVNPAQFSENEDLDSYPNTLEQDIEALKSLEVDVLFLPSKSEMYDKVKNVSVPVSELWNKLEGGSRPHFFKGVTTIVSKLFNVVHPSHTFFGEKDAQQLRVIKQMINDMQYNIKLFSCPTIRELNGLALSSRNLYLTKEQQAEASHFYTSLMDIKYHLDQGELNPETLKQNFERELKTNTQFSLDYISIACNNTLDEVIGVVCGDLLISAAVFFNGIRLIDNFTYQSST